MVRLYGPVPARSVVAVSGGVDSMALLHFLTRRRGPRPLAAFFHHGTPDSERAHAFLGEVLPRYGVDLRVGYLVGSRPRGVSPEEWWRESRYNFLDSLGCPVLTGHHLDDAAETWIWSSLHGKPVLLPYRRGAVLRPLLLNRKSGLEDWARRNGVEWIEDSSNGDTRYTRNYIRQELMPHALVVNPGLHTVLRKKLLQRRLTDLEECV